MPPAARLGDMALHDAPHCHAPIHMKGPVPTPEPHAPVPLAIIMGQPTVLIGSMPAATVTSNTAPCTPIPCVPGGPGLVAVGSSTVLICSLPAARVGDMVNFPGCVAPIPSPTGKILPPGCMTVMIGG